MASLHARVFRALDAAALGNDYERLNYLSREIQKSAPLRRHCIELAQLWAQLNRATNLRIAAWVEAQVATTGTLQ